MVKAPKYEKIGGKRRELSNSAKGMIVAFFVIYSDGCSIEKGPAGQHIWFSANLLRSGLGAAFAL